MVPAQSTNICKHIYTYANHLVTDNILPLLIPSGDKILLLKFLGELIQSCLYIIVKYGFQTNIEKYILYLQVPTSLSLSPLFLNFHSFFFKTSFHIVNFKSLLPIFPFHSCLTIHIIATKSIFQSQKCATLSPTKDGLSRYFAFLSTLS